MAVKKKNEPKTNEIMVVQETAISTVNVDQALQEWEAYQTITEKMLDDTDYQQIQGTSILPPSRLLLECSALDLLVISII